jgi:hypothetical protein
MKLVTRKAVVLFLLVLIFVGAGCAAGTATFATAKAGFWAGLWHGLICVITFVISLFSDTVRMYETNNAGVSYDLGFLIGALVALGGCGRNVKRKRRCRKEREWEEIGDKVEKKVRKAIKSWVDESEEEDREWEEIGAKIEEKIKRELKSWADE